jgi:HSP20 family protein
MEDGLTGLFRGLGTLIQIATALTERAAGDPNASPEMRRAGSSSSKGLHAVYGVSVRLGSNGFPVVAHFGNVRQNARDEAVVNDAREPMADIFDEGDHYVIVAELPGIEASALHWEVRDDTYVIVSATSTERTYYRELRLQSPIDPSTAASRYENGVLELKLWKQTPR